MVCTGNGQLFWVIPYLELELMEGNLQKLLEKRVLDREESAFLAHQLAKALAALHELGILHRSVSSVWSECCFGWQYCVPH